MLIVRLRIANLSFFFFFNEESPNHRSRTPYVLVHRKGRTTNCHCLMLPLIAKFRPRSMQHNEESFSKRNVITYDSDGLASAAVSAALQGSSLTEDIFSCQVGFCAEPIQ